MEGNGKQQQSITAQEAIELLAFFALQNTTVEFGSAKHRAILSARDGLLRLANPAPHPENVVPIEGKQEPVE